MLLQALGYSLHAFLAPLVLSAMHDGPSRLSTGSHAPHTQCSLISASPGCSAFRAELMDRLMSKKLKMLSRV